MIGLYRENEFHVNRDNNADRDKFVEDCLDIQSGEWTIFTQGYFMNIEELKCKYEIGDISELILKLVKEKKGFISTVLFGTYVLVAYNSISGEMLMTNDLLSKRSIFYCRYNNSIYFSDSFSDLIKDLRKYNIPLSIDSLGVKMMSRYQYFFDDVTYVNEIKFLKPFTYIAAKNTAICINNIPYPREIQEADEDTILKEIDKQFTHADLLQFKKNEVYGYPQITTLSGGWDSRMTFWYGYKNGYDKQICYCYSQANSIDEQIARSIALQCDCQFYHHALNGGNYLLERDQMCMANEGQMVYGDTGGIYDCMHMFSTDRWGIVHSGIGGGEVMGDLYRADENKAWQIFENTIGCDDSEKKRLARIIESYPSYNLFQNLNDIRHCLNAQKSSSPYCHYNSPYLYEEFWIYMMSLPFDIKKNRYIYRKWFERACSLKQHTTYHWGVRTASKFEHNLRRVWHKALVKVKGVSKYDMKPYFYWEKTNPRLMQILSQTYDTDLKQLNGKVSDEIIDTLSKDWKRFDLRMKMNVLTALWALRMIEE